MEMVAASAFVSLTLCCVAQISPRSKMLPASEVNARLRRSPGRDTTGTKLSLVALLGSKLLHWSATEPRTVMRGRGLRQPILATG